MKDKNEMTEAKAKDFIQYLSEARDQFVLAINKQEWNTELRTEAENLLIAYDQMKEKISHLSSPQEVSDEDIIVSANGYSVDGNLDRRYGFTDGAKWMHSKLNET